MAALYWKRCSVFQCVAVCCSVLQCVAVCCSMLQCVAVCCGVLQHVAACCSMLQHVAACCSVLQCVAMCCSVLQCACQYDVSSDITVSHWKRNRKSAPFQTSGQSSYASAPGSLPPPPHPPLAVPALLASSLSLPPSRHFFLYWSSWSSLSLNTPG